ncbi:hypothetical protein [Saliphagus sp. LR7]|uniref:hypothetical protein n=1 Tax=Saliphagus sp. LR7 TaxID=2282654 RepID=UPI000DF7AF70|nr:hypothetical protein [Saliphagus sp. LR7]
MTIRACLVGTSVASGSGERYVSKRRAIGAIYVVFGAILVVSSLPTRPLGVGLGLPFLVVGAWALRPTNRRQ